jgi:type VI secretion system secreted protein VgrG
MAHKGHSSSGLRTRGGILAAVAVALAGVALASAPVGVPTLGAARSFAVLGASTVTSTGFTVVTGNVGVSPGTAITGFPPATVTDGAIHAGDTAAGKAHKDAGIAYGFLAGMPSIAANNLTGTDLGGLTLAPGVYKFNTSAQLTGDLVLDAHGDSGAIFVFQIGTTLVTGTNASVVVINGGANYDESNVYWQVGSSATLGTGTDFTGNILAYSSISIVVGSTMTGNALALNGAVTMDSNVVTSPPLAPTSGKKHGK